MLRRGRQRPLGAQGLKELQHSGLEAGAFAGGAGSPALRERLEVPGGEVR
jgi:hypothetical protein